MKLYLTEIHVDLQFGANDFIIIFAFSARFTVLLYSGVKADDIWYPNESVWLGHHTDFDLENSQPTYRKENKIFF